MISFISAFFDGDSDRCYFVPVQYMGGVTMWRDLFTGLLGLSIFLTLPLIIVILGHWLYPFFGLKAYVVSFVVYFLVFYAFFHDIPCLGGGD